MSWSLAPIENQGVTVKLPHPAPLIRTWPSAAVAATWLVLFAAAVPAGQSQSPTFRASVDLIAVDVQVVDSSGRPISSIDPRKFEVTIDGKRRRVASADLVQASASTGGATSNRPVGSGPTASNLWPVPEGRGRTFVLAIDAGSFGPGDVPPVVRAAREFIDKLEANDLVGIFTLPRFGSRVDPTTDRAPIRRALDSVAGQRQTLAGQYNLSPSEIIDITAETGGLGSPAVQSTPPPGPAGRGGSSIIPVPIAMNAETLQRVQVRECRSTADQGCVEAIISEAAALAQHLEERAIQSLNGINALLDLLREYPGRKTVLVMSAGMAVSDRPGGRVEIGNEARMLGEQAAHANATIYAIHVDSGFSRAFSPESRRARDSGSLERERRMSAKVLDEFAGASGGALLSAMVGGGDIALDRVLLETSSYYLLGVEPAGNDRDGRAHRLHVKVNEKGVTVRSRQWVVLGTQR
jgi:VWFA-related protein